MRTVDRYLLLLMIRPFAVTITIALLTFLLGRMLGIFDLVLSRGGSIPVVLEILSLLLPRLVGLAVPIALFVAVLFTVMRLSEDREIDALQAMGVGLYRLLLPIMLFTVLLVGCTAMITEVVHPYASYRYKQLVHTVQNSEWMQAVAARTFYTGLTDKAIWVDHFDDDRGGMAGVVIFQENEDGTSLVTEADAARLYRSASDSSVVLRLERGRFINIDETGNQTKVVDFDTADVPYDFDQAERTKFRERGADELELTSLELLASWDDPPAKLSRAQIQSEFHARLARDVSILWLPLLAFALGAAWRHGGRVPALVGGVAILIVFHYALRFGKVLIVAHVTSPAWGLWMPVAVFAGFSTLAFWSVASRPGDNFIATILDRIGGLTTLPQRLVRIFRLLHRKPGADVERERGEPADHRTRLAG